MNKPSERIEVLEGKKQSMEKYKVRLLAKE